MEPSKDALVVTVTVSIHQTGYPGNTLHKIETTTTGPVGVEHAIDEARNLAGEAVKALRTAAARAEAERAKVEAAAEKPADKDEIPY